ncbi:MAG: L,D-transpeptidase, partial [Deltaproteobacteria bacterium]|nr:L,D-transpeptidase [Deltaproteobacteria bacterium]
GTFRMRDKHITHTMDSQVLGSEFELNDVPWVQYFKAGYALHAAYWHTEYGRPRSHGCINLSPIDAFRIFRWTEPHLPAGWHGVSAAESTSEGTLIHVRP